MCKQLELSYIGTNGEVKLPLENWQYAVIAQVLGLSIREDGPCTEIDVYKRQGNAAVFPVKCHTRVIQIMSENGFEAAVSISLL